jgi:NusA-like KH domain protein
MTNTLDMRDIRYINLFSKITNISTRHCFKYNEMIIFGVPEKLISKAIGEDGRNVKRISEIIGKKIRIIKNPESIIDARQFIKDIVAPVIFRNLEITENEIIINAGSQSKAALIGRNKRRLLELQKISKDYFKRDLRII